jgi:hypothetical protein
VLGTWGSLWHNLCRDTGPGFDIASVYNQGVFWAHKHQKSKSGSGHIPSTPPHPHSNPTPFSEPYTPYKHINNISAATQALVSAWTTLKHCHVLAEIHSKVQVSGDKQTELCMTLSSFKPHPFVFLCVSSIHHALARSLTNTPSLPFHHPPKPSFHHKHTSTIGGERLGKLLTSFFVFFVSFFRRFLLL